jgi:hypothetical protein
MSKPVEFAIEMALLNKASEFAAATSPTLSHAALQAAIKRTARMPAITTHFVLDRPLCGTGKREPLLAQITYGSFGINSWECPNGR